MCRVKRGVMWRVVFGGERVKGVGGTRAGRVQASRFLCFAHELAPYCIQHPIHHEIYISLRVTLPKTQPKKTQFSKNEKKYLCFITEWAGDLLVRIKLNKLQGCTV